MFNYTVDASRQKLHREEYASQQVWAAALTEFDVTWFIGIHAVGVATSDVSPHCH